MSVNRSSGCQTRCDAFPGAENYVILLRCARSNLPTLVVGS